MWFVWDGRSRSGPITEQEICRRVLGGEWSLSIFVRPEESSVYRPLTWMLVQWTSEKSRVEQTVVRNFAPQHEATQIAPVQHIETPPSAIPDFQLSAAPAPSIEAAPQFVPSASPSIEAAPQFVPSASPSIEAAPQFVPSASPSIEAAPQFVPSASPSIEAAPQFVPSASPPVEVYPETRPNNVVEKFDFLSAEFGGPGRKETTESAGENSVVRAAVAAIAEGERETREFESREPRKKSTDQNDKESPTLQVARRRTGEDNSVQSPAHASEGSVSLVDQQSATQIKFRRVNPTAPRRQSRSAGIRFGEKFRNFSLSPLKNRQKKRVANKKSFPTSIVASLVLGLIVVGGYLIYEKKQKQKETEISGTRQEIQTLAQTDDRSASRDETPPAVKQKKKKAMKARPAPIVTPVVPPAFTKATKSRIFGTSAELKSYLASSEPRGFVVIGPLMVQQRPQGRCSPCLGAGQLSDGTVIQLSSVMSKPWKAVTGHQVIYAKGFLIGSGKFTLTINALSHNPL